LLVREARPDEAARVYAVTRSAFLQYAADVPPPSALLETEPEVVRELSEGNWRALLAERDGRVLGCVRYELGRKGLHFVRLAVLPSARRQGVATALLGRLEEVAREDGRTRMWCHVRTKVAGNQALYERAGFAVQGSDIMVKGGFAIPVAVMAKEF
jgi:ribosomal protein S18 acetylase RimI-like enzyme